MHTPMHIGSMSFHSVKSQVAAKDVIGCMHTQAWYNVVIEYEFAMDWFIYRVEVHITEREMGIAMKMEMNKKKKKKKKLPIGISDFRKVIEEDYYYVDKSLLIKELLDSGSETILLPRPRRFGKTLNLYMLRYFFEKTEEDIGKLFHDLAIWQQGKAYTDKQGQYPVIFLTFKDVKSRDWLECHTKLNRVISEEYQRHRYLLDCERLYADEKMEYMNIIKLTASKDTYENSLKKLSVYLERHYGRKAIILIDEYDSPIQEGYLHGYYDDVIAFMRNMLSGALKDNTSLEQSILTGILRVAKESIFSGLNNLEVGSLLKLEYSTHFGLLEQEVAAMLDYYEVGTDFAEVKTWYNGYVFGDTVIYNPWSIINYAKSWKNGLQPYWVNTSSNDLVRQIITRSGYKVKEELETLLRGGSIRKEVNDNVVFQEIESSSDLLWSFLLLSGYLKTVAKERNIRLYCDLEIPNREVMYLFEDIVLKWFQSNLEVDQYDLMLESLLVGDIESFGDIFKEIVLTTFSYFDTSGRHPEKVYHAFVLGILVRLRDTYEVKSNRESGHGRYDVMLIPKGIPEENQQSKHRLDSNRKGIIIEFKNVRAGETLETAADAALKQIVEKRYTSELEMRGIQKILLLGITFAGKEVLIKSQVGDAGSNFL